MAAVDSCPSQQLAAVPDSSWGLEALGRYAQSQDRAIVAGERLLVPTYRNLGHALELARCQFNYRQWGKYLADLSIDPTRASKARAIYRTFPQAEALGNLSVKEAYAQRERKLKSSKTRAKKAKGRKVLTAEPVPDFVQSLIDVCRTAERCLAAAQTASAEQATLFLTALDEAAGELGKVREVLLRQAATN